MWRLLLALAACGRLGFDTRVAADARGSDTAFDAPGDGTPLALVQTVTAGNAGDELGFAVAVSRDGTRIIAGAPLEDTGNVNSGAAYVYARDATGWALEATLKGGRVDTNASFGNSVAISGDGSRVAVGMPGTAGTLGFAYIFVRTGTTWAQEAEAVGVGTSIGDGFGAAVAIDDAGDLFVVGAPGDGTVAMNAGAAYVFVHGGTTWGQTQKLTASNAAASDAFGQAVAIAGDGSRIFAAAPSEASAQGEVYAFQLAGMWMETAKIQEPVPDPGAFFGYAIAASQDGAHLAAGAPGNDTTVANSGAVYLDAQQLKAADAADNDQLGVAVAIAGTTVFGGAPLQGTDDGGSVVRFAAEQTEFVQAPRTSNAHFGEAVGTSGDAMTFAIGIPDDGAGKLEIHYFGQ